MKLRVHMMVTLVTLVTLSALMVSPVSAGGVACPPTAGGTIINDDINVTGPQCNFGVLSAARSSMNGNFKQDELGQNGTIRVRNTDMDGNIETKGNGTVSIFDVAMNGNIKTEVTGVVLRNSAMNGNIEASEHVRLLGASLVSGNVLCGHPNSDPGHGATHNIVPTNLVTGNVENC